MGDRKVGFTDLFARSLGDDLSIWGQEARIR